MHCIIVMAMGANNWLQPPIERGFFQDMGGVPLGLCVKLSCSSHTLFAAVSWYGLF